MVLKLFIPGPIDVPEEVRQKVALPLISHRDKEFEVFYAGLRTKLKRFYQTEADVFLSTSSATGIMEGAIRNTISKRALNLANGGFSDRWHSICLDNGKEADLLSWEWGQAVNPEKVEEKLKTGRYDVVTLVHNESSTGVMSPLKEIAGVMRRFPEVIFVVDAVSSLGAFPIPVDEWGIDVCLAGVQKAITCPPGLTVFHVSRKALEKAKSVPHRGYYFDFLVFKEFDVKNQTPTTPAISLAYALDYQMDRILREGLQNRYQRHLEMALYTRSWAREQNMKTFPEAGYESITLTTVENTRGLSVAALKDKVRRRGYLFSNGYGKLKEKTFRLAHMGECTLTELQTFLKVLDEELKNL